MAVELTYDYIAIAAFYIKLIVQAVRLILMAGTYMSMHDLILYSPYDRKAMLGCDNFWEDISNVSSTNGSMSYFLLCCLPGWVFYWVYEVLHTFFVVTAQSIAFFAMVF
jgi:hypothetical protein